MSEPEAEFLETGYEASTPPGDTLLRRALLTMTETQAVMAERMGGRVARWDDLVAAGRGSGHPMIDDALLQRPVSESTVAGVVERLATAYEGRGHSLFSAWPVPDLRPHGYQLVGHPPFMLRPAGGAAPPPPPGLRVVEAVDEELLAHADRVLIDGFPIGGVAHGGLLDGRLLDSPVRVWVGLEGDQPVAVAAGHAANGVVEVAMVATLPEARGKGYGEAVTWAATMADPSAPAILIASDPGRPVYERMGYLALFRFTIWFHP